MANECIPFKEPGGHVTGHASADVRGKRFVAISGNIQADGTLTVAEATGGARAVGVAAYDAKQGGKVGIIRAPRTVLPVTAGANLTYGAAVESDAQGRAVASASGVVLGYVETAATSGQDARVCLI